MKNFKNLLIAFLSVALIATIVWAKQSTEQGYVLQHEKEIAAEQPGPHNGGGKTLSHDFFAKAPGIKMAFRKRILYPGSSIGYHLQKEDEIYYILSGKGEMMMNGNSMPVGPGDAILTRPGSSHGIKPLGNDTLTLIINYELR